MAKLYKMFPESHEILPSQRQQRIYARGIWTLNITIPEMCLVLCSIQSNYWGRKYRIMTAISLPFCNCDDWLLHPCDVSEVGGGLAAYKDSFHSNLWEVGICKGLDYWGHIWAFVRDWIDGSERLQLLQMPAQNVSESLTWFPVEQRNAYEHLLLFKCPNPHIT